MSLKDDIKTVHSALRGSRYPEWPNPEPGDDRYMAFQAFRRICDQIPILAAHDPEG